MTENALITARRVIEDESGPMLVQTLNTFCQKSGFPVPHFYEAPESGFFIGHVQLNGEQFVGKPQLSKKTARQSAAHVAFLHLLTTFPRIAECLSTNSVSLLNSVCQRISFMIN